MQILKNVAVAGLGLLFSGALWAGSLTGMVGNWHIDEEKGQTVYDLSGNRLHGTLGPTSAVEAEDPVWTTRRFDTAALEFDGVEDLVRVRHSNLLQPAKISVEAWVKGTTFLTEFPRYIVAKSADGCNRAAWAIYTAEHRDGISFYVASSDSFTESPVALAEAVWNGAWHHVVGTYDRKAVRLFVDGAEVGTGTPATHAIAYNVFTVKDMHIGDYDGGLQCGLQHNFAGSIDDVRIWNRALTPAEVAARTAGY